MAAATLAGADGFRMEEKKLEYFSSINSMARKIMQEREKIKQKHGSSWDQMSPTEQDDAIDTGMMDPHIRARYAMHRVDRQEVVCYPKLLIQTGQKIVHFGEEDITWQDEHSSPFSWETKSQLDFSLTSGPSEQGVGSSLTDTKPSKLPQSIQLNKATPNNKVSNGEGLSLGRKEEESSFWKISAERSRLEGEQDFHSLTPSQIKSLEKGEKPLPSYLRQENSSIPKEPEELPPPPRVSKQRAPKPPAPPPPIPVTIAPPSAISVPLGPAPLSVSSTVAGWERAQSTLPSVSISVDDVFSPGLAGPAPAPAIALANAAKSPGRSGTATRTNQKPESPPPPPPLATSPTFSQFNTSSNLLKTGFDFLDNW